MEDKDLKSCRKTRSISKTLELSRLLLWVYLVVLSFPEVGLAKPMELYLYSSKVEVTFPLRFTNIMELNSEALEFESHIVDTELEKAVELERLLSLEIGHLGSDIKLLPIQLVGKQLHSNEIQKKIVKFTGLNLEYSFHTLEVTAVYVVTLLSEKPLEISGFDRQKVTNISLTMQGQRVTSKKGDGDRTEIARIGGLRPEVFNEVFYESLQPTLNEFTLRAGSHQPNWRNVGTQVLGDLGAQARHRLNSMGPIKLNDWHLGLSADFAVENGVNFEFPLRPIEPGFTAGDPTRHEVARWTGLGPQGEILHWDRRMAFAYKSMAHKLKAWSVCHGIMTK